jgi:hypothetical protein
VESRNSLWFLLIALKKKKKMGEYIFTKLQARGGMLLYFEPFLLVSSTIARPVLAGMSDEFSEL